MSTSSGIKLMTFVVLILSAYSYLRQREEIRIFNRSIAEHTIRKAFALTVISVSLIWIAFFLLPATHNLRFIDTIIEVVSAFGTVGLLRGITGEFNPFGQFLIMFLGRIGPLTLGSLLAKPKKNRLRYPSKEIPIG